MSRFAMTYCSQCGSEQGPGNEGVSHCSDHRRRRWTETKTYSDGTLAIGSVPLPALSPPQQKLASFLGMVEDYGRWLWDCGFMDSPTGEFLVDDAADRRKEIASVLNSLMTDAYAEGRKDEAEATYGPNCEEEKIVLDIMRDAAMCCRERHSYMPTTEEDRRDFRPHLWVLEGAAEYANHAYTEGLRSRS
jgi:hypothetical protein